VSFSGDIWLQYVFSFFINAYAMDKQELSGQMKNGKDLFETLSLGPHLA
jgi:hypothetical protein